MDACFLLSQEQAPQAWRGSRAYDLRSGGVAAGTLRRLRCTDDKPPAGSDEWADAEGL